MIIIGDIKIMYKQWKIPSDRVKFTASRSRTQTVQSDGTNIGMEHKNDKINYSYS